MNNYAFIDGQNLHSGVKELGWTLDYKKLFDYLSRKYHVTKAYYFIGQIPKYQNLYDFLGRSGYELVFKPVVQGSGHDPKGNVDADLVVRALVEVADYDQAVIVAGDGDYYSLVEHLDGQRKLFAVVAPNRRYCSSLLRRAAKGKLRYIEDVRRLVERV